MVVAAGDTVMEPFTGFAPIPWSIVTVVAFAVVHVSVAVPPEAMTEGVAVNVICGVPEPVTVTVAVTVLVPPAPVAVSV